MSLHLLRIEPRSGFITPIQADTLFGHLAWAYRHRRGEEALGDLLKAFESDPPFLISDGFPADYLPFPKVSPSPEDLAALAAFLESAGAGLDGRAILGQVAKKIKKVGFVPLSVLRECVEKISWREIVSRLVEPMPGVRSAVEGKPGRYLEVEGFDGIIRIAAPKSDVEVLTMKNRMDRRSNTVSAGGLFSIEEKYIPHHVDIWVDLREFSKDDFTGLFQDVEKIGYGKRKSAGQGQFRVVSFEPAELPRAASPTHFMALSAFVPAVTDPLKGAYSVRVKRGKIGENWAEFGGFLKKPLFMLESGSLFHLPAEPRPWYGSLVKDVHQKPEIRHYGYALPMMVRV